jgi:hypothetical protein
MIKAIPVSSGMAFSLSAGLQKKTEQGILRLDA